MQRNIRTHRHGVVCISKVGLSFRMPGWYYKVGSSSRNLLCFYSIGYIA